MAPSDPTDRGDDDTQFRGRVIQLARQTADAGGDITGVYAVRGTDTHPAYRIGVTTVAPTD